MILLTAVSLDETTSKVRRSLMSVADANPVLDLPSRFPIHEVPVAFSQAFRLGAFLVVCFRRWGRLRWFVGRSREWCWCHRRDLPAFFQGVDPQPIDAWCRVAVLHLLLVFEADKDLRTQRGFFFARRGVPGGIGESAEELGCGQVSGTALTADYGAQAIRDCYRGRAYALKRPHSVTVTDVRRMIQESRTTWAHRRRSLSQRHSCIEQTANTPPMLTLARALA